MNFQVEFAKANLEFCQKGLGLGSRILLAQDTSRATQIEKWSFAP